MDMSLIEKKQNSKLKKFCPYLRQKAFKMSVLIFFLLPVLAIGQDGTAIFKSDCSACHKLGTKLVGPDLKQVTTRRSEDWFKKFVRSSQTFINSGDPDAKAIFQEFNQLVMPDNPHLSDTDLSALYSYLVGEAASGSAASALPIPALVINYSQQEVKMGRALFLGSDSFENGGASCISCHHANNKDVAAGGLLAKDLTEVYTRLGDDAIRSIVNSPPYPVMTEAYKSRKLTEKEVVYLAAFLQDVDSKSPNQALVSADFVFFKWGLGVFALIILSVGLIWKKRKASSVKSEIFKRQLTSI
jgi:cytochrome c551/c552